MKFYVLLQIKKLALRFGSKPDLTLQINCEHFIRGCMVGFRVIFDQRLFFPTLDKNSTAQNFYFGGLQQFWETQ